MGAGMRYQPQVGPVRVDASIGADFAWAASLGTVLGPKASGTFGKSVTPAGIGINSGYAVLSGKVPSCYTTTWTEIGSVLLDGTNTVATISSRDEGQAVLFRPSLAVIDLVMWGVIDVDISGTLPTGLVNYVIRRVGSAHSVWLNGKLFGTASNASTPVQYVSVLPAIGAHAASGPNAGAGSLVSTNGVLAVARTTRGLNDAQCIALSANPWQLFQAPDEEEDLVLAAGAYTLTGATGLFALTGSAASIAAGRKLGATNAAFAVTGNGASLTFTRKIQAAPGSFALAVSAASLIVARKLAASSGAFALSGNAVGIVASRRITASIGSFSVAGSAANLVYTPRPAPGSYTLTASAGSFALTGNAAGSRAARRLVAAPGSFAILGSGAEMAIGRRLMAAMGSVAITGGTAGLRVERRIAAAAGSFVITGGAAVLAYSSSVQYARAPSGSSFAPQQTAIQRRSASTISLRPASTQRNSR